MMDNLQKIAERLKYSYERIVYPSAMGDVPIELEKLAKHDEDGNVVGHYSINEMSDALGSLLVPMKFNSSGTLMHIRWSFDKHITADGLTDEAATRKLLEDKGLVDMLKDATAEEIVIGELPDNSYGIFGSFEFKEIPDEVAEDEE